MSKQLKDTKKLFMGTNLFRVVIWDMLCRAAEEL